MFLEWWVAKGLLRNLADWQIPQQPWLLHRAGVAFLIPGLWSAMVACSEFQMLSAGYGTEAAGGWAHQQRAVWPQWHHLVAFFYFSSLSFDQRENLMTCHLILLKFPVISVMNSLFGAMMVLRKVHYCRVWGEEISCSGMSATVCNVWLIDKIKLKNSSK